MREGKDRGGTWLIKHYGDALLHLAGIRGFEKWRAIQPQVIQQGRTPDGLLEIVFSDEKEPDLVLLEIYTYPNKDVGDDILRNVALMFLNRRKVPEVVVLFLHPKGNQEVAGEITKESRQRLTRFQCKWQVLELWKIPAEQLLAAKEVGLIPWVPLAQYQGSPEVLLQQCRQRIEKEAPPREINNLLAITYIMARMRYNVAELLALLGEGPMIDFLKNPWRYKSTWLSNPFRI